MLDDARGSTVSGRLARIGFADPAAAERILAEIGLLGAHDSATILAVGAAADPDLALTGLRRLVDAAPDRAPLLDALRDGDGFRARLFGVLGASAALGDHLARHPDHWHVLVDDAVTASRPTLLGLQRSLLGAVGADPSSSDPVAASAGVDALVALRAAYRCCLLGLAARDLSGVVAVDEVAGELADLAGATLAAALAVARAGLPAEAAPCRLAVIGMGKCGGRELNYVSDVDVVFAAEPSAGANEELALRTATALAGAMARVCSETTSEGSIWPVDAALRPEGKSGPLVRTVASHEAYYKRWAKPWEFQALLKARPVAGDLDLGRRYIDTVAPLVWSAAERPGFIDEVRAMRRRVEETLPKADAARELKLGPGGLRDVEFAVQLLQLVHGRTDPALRSVTTLSALHALADGGYVGREDAARLGTAYRFLRTVEHRLQLYRLRRTHLMPDDEPSLRRLGRALGFTTHPVAELHRAHTAQAREVRRLHEKLFYRPLLAAVARLPADEARLSPAQAQTRLEALGYADPAGALRHLGALTRGVSRRATIQRTLLPVMLGWFADAADPDAGLLAFRQLSDAVGSTPWYLRLLRDEGMTAERLAHVLAGSRYVADLMARAPEAVRLLADDEELAARPADALTAEFVAAAGRRDDWEGAVATVRGLRRRELLRTAMSDLLGLRAQADVGVALADVAAATVAAALDVAARKVAAEWRSPLPMRLAVIGMGRFGGREQGYGSDADVLFVHDPNPGVADDEAARAAHDVANEFRRLLALPAPDPPLEVDADLRPEGRQGPLTRSLASYQAYYERWGSIWESQALLRARYVAGDEQIGARFAQLIAPLRWPADGLDSAAIREIRRIKARVEAERLPRGADPSLHTKLGRGGLADVEWTVQLVQLRFAHQYAELRTTSTLEALAGIDAAGLLPGDDVRTLSDAWQLATRVRNAVVLFRGRPADSLPSDLRELSGVARAVGYSAGRTADLVEDYRRVTRRARAVVERTFYA
ncbi:MAG: bifunctional [glutamine synthetase] adenylyltransferase/[glutamine synthetase]-adenylyl-L-tyrosine phosphorylase [Actinomycetes bacterium]